MRIVKVKDGAERGIVFPCVENCSDRKERAIVSEMGIHDRTMSRIRVRRKYSDSSGGDA